jgi:hypothetical protein
MRCDVDEEARERTEMVAFAARGWHRGAGRLRRNAGHLCQREPSADMGAEPTETSVIQSFENPTVLAWHMLMLGTQQRAPRDGALPHR